MDWAIFWVTFLSVFIAELGDKTQIAGLSLVAKSHKPLSVFIGSIAGYILATIITVVLGLIISKFIKPEFIRYFTALLFIVIGLLILLGKI